MRKTQNSILTCAASNNETQPGGAVPVYDSRIDKTTRARKLLWPEPFQIPLHQLQISRMRDISTSKSSETPLSLRGIKSPHLPAPNHLPKLDRHVVSPPQPRIPYNPALPTHPHNGTSPI